MSDSTQPAVFVHEDGTPMTIFISHECPARSTFVKMVQDRKGKIVVTDKGADVCVGDHMKAKTPGLVSYHWIEECCAKDEVVDTAPHVIALNRPSIRTGGPAGMRTARRNEFTPQDDSLLIEYLKSQVAVNRPIGGNAPYNDFADAHPQHTSQSWRNRWMKVLGGRKDVRDAVEAVRGTGFSDHIPTRQDDVEEEEIPAPRSTARQSFGWNREQDEVILRAVQQPSADPENPTFWVRLAATHVAHGFTADQWRERYFNRLQPELRSRRGPPRQESVSTEDNDPPVSTVPLPVKRHVSLQPTPLTVPKRQRQTTEPTPSKGTSEEPTPMTFPKRQRQTTELTPSKPSFKVSRAPIPKTPAPVEHAPTSSPQPGPATDHLTPQSRYSLPDLPRSVSVPTAARRVTAPLKSMSVAPPQRPHQSFSSPLIQDPNLIYHDPVRSTRIWRTPHIDSDDRFIEQTLRAPQSSGKTNRIRLSLGDINIEIESHDPVLVGSSPQFRPSPQVRSTAQFPGTSARRTTGGVIPSTPGSSPAKLKAESLRSEEEDIYGDQPLIHRYSPELPDTSIPLDDEDEIVPETEEMQIDDEAPVGAETQAFFDADDEEDLSVPNIEFQTPAKRTPRKRAGSKFLEDPQGWVEDKARRHGVETELVYWVLERTTGRHKLALKALKHFQKENRLPEIPGVWTVEEDEILRQGNARRIAGLDEKHGYGAALDRRRFLDTWKRASRQHRR